MFLQFVNFEYDSDTWCLYLHHNSAVLSITAQELERIAAPVHFSCPVGRVEPIKFFSLLEFFIVESFFDISKKRSDLDFPFWKTVFKAGLNFKPEQKNFQKMILLTLLAIISMGNAEEDRIEIDFQVAKKPQQREI